MSTREWHLKKGGKILHKAKAYTQYNVIGYAEPRWLMDMQCGYSFYDDEEQVDYTKTRGCIKCLMCVSSFVINSI